MSVKMDDIAATSFFGDLARDASARPRNLIERPDVFDFLERQRLIYQGDTIAFRYQADCLAGTGGWEYERLFDERFFAGQPYLFIEFKQSSRAYRQFGFVIEIFDRGELLLNAIEDDQAATIRAAGAQLLDQVNHLAPLSECPPLVRWARAVQYLFRSQHIVLAARPDLSSNDEAYHPNWTFGAVLEHCPSAVQRVARVTGFYRHDPVGLIRHLPIRWHFIIGHHGRLLSVPFEQAAEIENACPAESSVTNDEMREILLSLLFIWAAVGEEAVAPSMLAQPLPMPITGRAVIERARRDIDSDVLDVSDQIH